MTQEAQPLNWHLPVYAIQNSDGNLLGVDAISSYIPYSPSNAVLLPTKPVDQWWSGKIIQAYIIPAPDGDVVSPEVLQTRMLNKRYLFLVAWVEGSDTASGELTQVNDQSDLVPQFLTGNQHVMAVEVFAPNEEIAYAFGCKEAFDNNYTGHDSVSMVVEIGTDDLPTIPHNSGEHAGGWKVVHA